MRLHPLHGGYLLTFFQRWEIGLQDEAVLAALWWHQLNIVRTIMVQHAGDGRGLNSTLVGRSLLRFILIAVEEGVAC